MSELDLRASEYQEQAKLKKARAGVKHAIVFSKHHLPYNPGDMVGFLDRDVAKRFVDQGFAKWDPRFMTADGYPLSPEEHRAAVEKARAYHGHPPLEAVKVEAVPEASKVVKK